MGYNLLFSNRELHARGIDDEECRVLWVRMLDGVKGRASLSGSRFQQVSGGIFQEFFLRRTTKVFPVDAGTESNAHKRIVLPLDS